MDAFVVEEPFDPHGNGHVVGGVATSNVSSRYDARRRQLPYVQLVHFLDSFHLNVNDIASRLVTSHQGAAAKSLADGITKWVSAFDAFCLGC